MNAYITYNIILHHELSCCATHLKTLYGVIASLFLATWNYYLVLRFNKYMAVLTDNRQVHKRYLKKENII